MNRLFSIVSIFVGLAMVSGLFVGAFPTTRAYASTPQSLVASPLIIDDLDDLLDIGDLDDELGLRVRGIRAFVDDDVDLRDILLTRITRLLLLRSTLLGNIDADDILEDFRFELKDILRRRDIDVDVNVDKIELGLGLRRFLLRRDQGIRDIEDLIRDRSAM